MISYAVKDRDEMLFLTLQLLAIMDEKSTVNVADRAIEGVVSASSFVIWYTVTKFLLFVAASVSVISTIINSILHKALSTFLHRTSGRPFLNPLLIAMWSI